MTHLTRRMFFGNVGETMLVGGIGAELASSLGLWKGQAERRGVPKDPRFDRLVALMQETAPAELQRKLIAKIKAGTELETLVAAGAIANARSLGGEDYRGYHAFMALMPALQMSREQTGPDRALPVLKVLWRNASRIQTVQRGRTKLRAIESDGKRANVAAIRKLVAARDAKGADRAFASMLGSEPAKVWNEALHIVHDNYNVHTTVLAWRAWDMLQLAGTEHADPLMRQMARYWVHEEERRVRLGNPVPGIRTLLPKLVDEHGLFSKQPGTRQPTDDWIRETASSVHTGSRDTGARVVAQAIADGYALDAIAEAISLAANTLVLEDKGNKRGEVHGASVGVHASDAAHAWRRIVAAAAPRNRVASLVVAGYHTAGQRRGASADNYPYLEASKEVEERNPKRLLALANGAIRNRDQVRAGAVVHKLGELGHSAEPVFRMLYKHAVDVDGSLHAEKYYRTVREEFATTRESMRWHRLVALARVTASAHGVDAAGVAAARAALVG